MTNVAKFYLLLLLVIHAGDNNDDDNDDMKLGMEQSVETMV